MKKYTVVLLCILTLFVLSGIGCAEKESESSVSGKKYIYSGEHLSGFENDNDFTITINDDGTYSYNESSISSYIGHGKWSVSDDLLTLSDDTGVEIINYFIIDGEDIVFTEENSTNFIYVKVKDKERFYGTMVDNDN